MKRQIRTEITERHCLRSAVGAGSSSQVEESDLAIKSDIRAGSVGEKARQKSNS